MDVKTYNKAVDLLAGNLFRFVLKMTKNKTTADDIVQECFTRLWEKKHQVNPQKVKSYLFTTAHHLVIDYFRKNKRIEYSDTLPVTQQGSIEPIGGDLQDILHEALERLPVIQKTVVLLRDYEGYSYREIAEITRLSETQVKVYIFRARKQLKNYLVSIDYVL